MTKALDDVEQLLKDLLALEPLDLAKLEDAEKRFEVANSTITGQLDLEFEKVKMASASQSKQIENFNLDLGPLEKEIKHVEGLHKALPQKCMKPEPPPA